MRRGKIFSIRLIFRITNTTYGYPNGFCECFLFSLSKLNISKSSQVLLCYILHHYPLIIMLQVVITWVTRSDDVHVIIVMLRCFFIVYHISISITQQFIAICAVGNKVTSSEHCSTKLYVLMCRYKQGGQGTVTEQVTHTHSHKHIHTHTVSLSHTYMFIISCHILLSIRNL